MAMIEEVIGRYLHLTVGGVTQRIYFEECGEGIPLLCLHTAGADSRQYRHILADKELTKSFKIIAFDLPWHGRSLPPDAWWEKEYLLTAEVYAQTVEAFSEALGLDKPIVMGCSMAGSLVLELVRRDPKKWRCAIGLSGAANVAGRFQDWSLAPDINAQQSVASWTSSLMAPMSPEKCKREVWWIYSQGGPGVYRGDTYFYSEDLDLRGRESEIDALTCPVYLLTGEYDHACTIQDTQKTIDAIPGARGGPMKEIGHFPVSENYPLFKEYLNPILDQFR